MTKITLTIPGEPAAKQRPRWSKWGMHTPKKTVDYETYIKELFVIKHPEFVPLEAALSLEFTAYMTIPKSASKRRQELMRIHQIRPTKKPDIDNIEKIILDALEGLAYKNDNQFVQVFKEKLYSKIPRLEILISDIMFVAHKMP